MAKLNELTDKLDGLEVKPLTLDNYLDVEELCVDFTEDMQQIIDTIEKMKKLGNKQQLEKLYSDQSKVDNLINESNHMMENVDLNASEGFKAYKFHQMLCRKRREIKKSIEHQKVIKDFIEKQKALLGDLKNLNRQIKNTSPNNEHSYVFRNLDSLEEFKRFDGVDFEKFGVYSKK